MKTDRPILFSGAMVRAILDGRKSMTRRVVKPQPKGSVAQHSMISHRCWLDSEFNGDSMDCPHGQPGDTLWVRETVRRIHFTGPGCSVFDADMQPTVIDNWGWKRDVLPSIHMPRGVSRITLEITAVRVERLQEITEADAKAEGIESESVSTQPGIYNYRAPFAELWDNLNRDRGFGWDVNPWVFVISFKRIKP